MLQKLLASTISFAVLMFGSYDGNDVSFSQIELMEKKNKIFVQADLENAFDNDFQSIFRSGESITIWFRLEIRKGKELIKETKIRHIIVYDPLDNMYQVFLEDTGKSFEEASFDQLITQISDVQFEIETEKLRGVYNVELEASLETIYLESMQKNFNLMALWKFKKPTVKALIRS